MGPFCDVGDEIAGQPSLPAGIKAGYGARRSDAVKDYPRVAFFTDSFNEINGVALTSRQLVESARRKQRPFLRVSAGPETRLFNDGSISALELKRGRCSFPIELDQRYDILHWRYSKLVVKTLRDFQPDGWQPYRYCFLRREQYLHGQHLGYRDADCGSRRDYHGAALLR